MTAGINPSRLVRLAAPFPNSVRRLPLIDISAMFVISYSRRLRLLTLAVVER